MFRKNYKNLKHQFEKMEVHFLRTPKYYKLVSKNVMDAAAKKSVYEARTLREEQHSSYKKGVFVRGSKSIYEYV